MGSRTKKNAHDFSNGIHHRECGCNFAIELSKHAQKSQQYDHEFSHKNNNEDIVALFFVRCGLYLQQQCLAILYFWLVVYKNVVSKT